MYSFLVLSFLSGMIELGSVYLGIRQVLPIYQIIALPLFYQGGNLMMNIFPTKASSGLPPAMIAILLVAVYYFYPGFWILAVQLVCSSYSIQLARMQYKSECPTYLKRSFRIGGFILSPVMCLCNGQIVILSSMLFCIGLMFANTKMQLSDNKLDRRSRQEKTGISTVMIFHQMHYFVYTYVMPIYAYLLTGSIILSALMFSATWVIYLMPQTIAERFNVGNYKKIFFFCHLFLSICMGVMAVSAYLEKNIIILVAWLLTGLGGGSVFCIRHLCKGYESINMDFSENIGHFFGSLVAVIMCYIFRESAIVFLSATSAIFVVIAIIISLYITRKEHYYEERNNL